MCNGFDVRSNDCQCRNNKLNSSSYPGPQAQQTHVAIPSDYTIETLDGEDIVAQAAGGTGVSLKDFAANFGDPDCSPTI